MRSIKSERALAALAVALGAERVRGRSARETVLATDVPAIPRLVVEAARRQIERGRDPLETALCVIRTAEERSPRGATYTGHLAAAGLATRAEILVGDFRNFAPPDNAGRGFEASQPSAEQ